MLEKIVLSSELGPELSPVENEMGEMREIIDAEVDPDLSRKLDHKFDLHIVPWIFGIW